MPSKTGPIQYQPAEGVPLWKVELFDALSSQFGVTEDQLPQFHQLAERFSRSWDIIRQIFGVNPIIVPLGTDAKFLSIQSKLDVAVSFGLDEEGLNSEMAVVGAAWSKFKNKKPRKKVLQSAPESPTKTETVHIVPNVDKVEDAKPPVAPKLNDDANALLQKYGFHDSHFYLIGRNTDESKAEREWMVLRLQSMQKLLDEPMVSSMVLQALTNEMLIVRLSRELLATKTTDPKFHNLQETKKTLEKEYREQWAEISEKCPWAAQVEQKVQGTGSVSDFYKAVMNHYAKKCNKLIDYFWTALEIQILLRESVQAEIRYRRGQTAYLVEALTPEALFDPNWKSSFTPYQCKLLDEGFKEAAKRFRESTGIHLPDLEDKGPAGEYPPLFVPGGDEPESNIILTTK